MVGSAIATGALVAIVCVVVAVNVLCDGMDGAVGVAVGAGVGVDVDTGVAVGVTVFGTLLPPPPPPPHAAMPKQSSAAKPNQRAFIPYPDREQPRVTTRLLLPYGAIGCLARRSGTNFHQES